MKLLTVLLAYLAVQVTACPSYYDYLNFFPNHTSITNQTLGRRWNDGVTSPGNFRRPWPQDPGSQIHTIPYCYVDITSWQALNAVFDQAVKKWTDKIGPPGQDSGHALRIQEVNGPGFQRQPFCVMHSNGNPVIPPVWNPLVDPGTLAVTRTMLGGRGGEATVGYRSLDPSLPGPQTGRNRMVVNVGEGANRQSLRTITHELGHVFGLFHEHQRSDRDKYIHVDCKYFLGYDDALKAVQDQTVESRRGKGDTIEQVCADPALAQDYNFLAAAQFTKTNIAPNGDVMTQIEGPFDVDSIMLYDSLAFRKPTDSNVADLFDVPMVRWKVQNQDPPPTTRTRDNCDFLYGNYDVSNLDVEAIKHVYPWSGS